MTIDELYQKVEKKMETIDKENPYLYYDLKKVYNVIKNAEIPSKERYTQGALPYVSVDESLCLASQFLEQCSPEYKERLLDDYVNGKIEFRPGENSYVVMDSITKDYKIVVSKTDTITQASELVHEFFHTLNLNNNITSHNAFTETVPEIAEEMFLIFLQKQGYSEYDINLVRQERGNDYINNLEYLKIMLPLFLSKKETGKLDSTDYDSLLETSQISQSVLEKNLISFSDDSKHHFDVYKYVMGYMLTKSFLNSNPSEQELKEINDYLKNSRIRKFENRLLGSNSIDEVHQCVKRDEFSYQPKQYKR